MVPEGRGGEDCKWALCNVGLGSWIITMLTFPVWWALGLCQHNLRSGVKHTGGRRGTRVCKQNVSLRSVIHNTPFGLEDRSGGSRTSGASACLPCVLSCRAGCRKIHSTAPLHPSGFFFPRATELSVLGPSLRSASESFKSVTFSWFSIHSPPSSSHHCGSFLSLPLPPPFTVSSLLSH